MDLQFWGFIRILVCIFLVCSSHMGGAVSVAPASDTCFQRVAVVAQKSSRSNYIFDNIARMGYRSENIMHPNMGKKNDELCLTEVVLYIVKANDMFFRNFVAKPIVIIKEAYCYCFRVSSGKVLKKNKDMEFLKIDRAKFRTFLQAYWLFSRLWEFFFCVDRDSSADELLLSITLENNSGCYNGIYAPLLSKWWKEEFANAKIHDKNMKATYIKFIGYCVTHVVTPEAYFKNDGQNKKLQYENDSKTPQFNVTSSSIVKDWRKTDNVENEYSSARKQYDDVPPVGPVFSRSTNLDMDLTLINDDIDVSHFSPINSTDSIIIRSNSIPLEMTTEDVNTCFKDDHSAGNGDICLSVDLRGHESAQGSLTEESRASLGVSGVAYCADGYNAAHHQDSSLRRADSACLNVLPERVSSFSGHQKLDPCRPSAQAWQVQSITRPPLDWRSLNKKRDIIHHPAMSSNRAVYAVEDSPCQNLVTIKTFPKKVESFDAFSTPKCSWRRSRDERATLWNPRHAKSTKKLKFSTVRTVKM